MCILRYGALWDDRRTSFRRNRRLDGDWHIDGAPPAFKTPDPAKPFDEWLAEATDAIEDAQRRRA